MTASDSFSSASARLAIPVASATPLASIARPSARPFASVAFALYVANFSSYDKTYGALGGVVVFLLWLWITNLAILLGAEFNAETERRTVPSRQVATIQAIRKDRLRMLDLEQIV